MAHHMRGCALAGHVGHWKETKNECGCSQRRTFSFTIGTTPNDSSSEKVASARAYCLLDARLSAVMST